MRKNKHTGRNRLLALGLAAVLAVSALAIGLGGTLAAKPAVTANFAAQPNAYTPLAVGQTATRGFIGLRMASSGNTAKATIEIVPSTSDIIVRGIQAGTVTIVAGSSSGLLVPLNYQIFDDRNIVSYSVPNGGEVFFSKADGSTKANPAKVVTGLNTTAANQAAFDDITWESLQTDVASVDNTSGAITCAAKGAAIILGTFTDKWGVKQTIHILVGVEVSLGDPELDDLLKALAKAYEIQDDADENPEKYIGSGLDVLNDAVAAGETALNDPGSNRQQAADGIWDAVRDLQRKLRKNKLEDAIAWGEEILDAAAAGDAGYDEDLLQELEDALEAGKLVLDDPGATDDDCNAAADAILDVIKKIVGEGGGGNADIIQGADGKWYRRLGRPPHVYELLDDDKKSTYPPEYIYNEDDEPGTGKDRRVYGPKNGFFYVEDPEGSNIYKPVDGDGNISDDDAVWGGPDKQFGTEDDLPAVLNEETGKWYACYGQNVYQEIGTAAGSPTRGLLIGTPFGAGENGVPGDGNELRPIFPLPNEYGVLKPYGDGKFYAGPFGSATDPNGVYFIGDKPWYDGSDGELNTSGKSGGVYADTDIADTDQRWYMDANGNMVTGRINYNVTGVTVSPAAADLYQGQGFLFTATAAPAATTPQVFNWTVEGAQKPGTVINNIGMLVIDPNETAAVLTVRAACVVAPAWSGTAAVTVSPDAPVMTKATVEKIATGRSSFLIKDNGTLWGAGLNNRGQLGIGDTRNRTAYVPALVSPATLTFAKVSAFAYGTESHTLGIASDGTLYTWGYNNRGQLGNGTTANRNTPGLTSLSTGTKFIAVAAGRSFSAAIAADGRLYTWGYGSDGQMGSGGTASTNSSPQPIPTDLRFQAVSAGDRCVYAITNEGTYLDDGGEVQYKPGKLYAWGYNGSGRLGTGDTTRRTVPTQVAVGGSFDPVVKMVAGRSLGHVLVLKSDGTAYSCGYNGYGQLGDGSTTSRSTLSIPVGTVKFKTVGTGHNHSMALTADGSLYAWGYNNYGQLGNGNTTRQRTPVWISRDSRKYVAMAAGEYTSMAVCAEGRLYLWGYNNYGQFGNGTTVRQNYPHFVPLA